MNDQVYVALGDTNHGWVQLAFMTTERFQNAVIFCSDVFNPFPAIKNFLGCVQRNLLPTQVTVNEESTQKTLRVSQSAAGRGLVEFVVSNGSDIEDKPRNVLLSCTIKRSDLVASFDRGIARWLIDGYDVNHFGGGYGVAPECDVGKLWAKRLAKLPKREIKPYKPRQMKLSTL